MQNKKLFTDVETTGLDAKINGVHQISGIIVIDDEEVERFDLKIRPFEDDLVETFSLGISDVTYNQVMTYQDPKQAHEQLIEILNRHCNRFRRVDKFHFFAYNSNYDNGHYREFFNKVGDTYFGSWFHTPDICVMRLAANYLQNERHKLDNFQLKTVAEYLGVVKENDETIKYHDAMVDVEITKAIYYKIINGD